MNNDFNYGMYQDYQVNSNQINYNKKSTIVTPKKQNKLQKIVVIILLMIIVVILILLMMMKSKEKDIKVVGVNIIKSSLTMIVEEMETLNATVLPTNATNKNLEWLSDNNLIVTVDKNGMVVAKSPGVTTITVKTMDGGFKDSINITVKPKTVLVSSVEIEQSNFELEVGKSKTLSVTVLPTNATNKEVEWSSSNEEIATIDENGKVVAKAEGTTTITVKTIDGEYKDNINVTVKPKVISVTDIQVSLNSLLLDKGSSKDIGVTILPTNATYKTFSCESNNQSVVTSSVNGNSCRITGVSVGNAQVTVYSHDKKNNAIINVTVQEPKIKVNINVATWNIHRYRDANSDLIAEKMATLNLDIIGLQETRTYGSSSSQEESGSKYRLGEIGKKTGLNNYYYTHTPAGNATLSNKSLVTKTSTGLASCHESRSLQKSVINVNNVDISFYNTHLSYQTNCPQIQLESVYNIIKNDVNPVILVGDFNVGPSTILNNVLGSDYKIIAHDTNRQIYADSIIINGKGKLQYVDGSAKTIVTTGVLSDHNLVMATISVVN